MGLLMAKKKGLSLAESEIAQIDKQIMGLMQPLASKMIDIFAHYNRFILSQKQTSIMLASAIAEKIAGDALAENPLANVEQVCKTCIEQMLGEAEMHIYVNTLIADQLEEKLIQHFSRSHEPGHVLIHKDEKLALSACRIEWKHGGLQYDPASVKQEMQRLVESISAAEPLTHTDITPENIQELSVKKSREYAL
ncbi:MAG: hypothetical protein LRY50_13090 [Geovibrio sp.]|nr:hypothetical protein [Geovibrio sp.]